MSTALTRRLPDPVIGDLVSSASIEILPAEWKKLDAATSKLKRGTRVYVAYTSDGTNEIVAAAEYLSARGLVPVPHFPARRFRSHADLKEFLEKLATDAGITSALLIGGDLYQPMGPYTCVMDLLETGLFQAHGIRDIGFAGHPEGHPDVSEDVLRDALIKKCDYAEQSGMKAYVATQFLFDVPKLVAWQQNFIESTVPGLPIDVGVPGFAKISTLLRFAKNCGVRASTSMLMKHTGKALLLASAFSPDEILAELATAVRAAGKPIFRAVHLYPFGSFERTADWLHTLRQTNIEVGGI